ncbi:hypothetical protein, unlikely [Trypanosoma brucei gambiense DAL972]|uniref:Uncharacterized protein n=1 Tax=Trypanosoma brucei gambiense (strain MHOM/CI/86/DAL972) TaxID=679716 RepID=D0A1A4_TRYB9|nr:hypothetical protein, unlikely [Trypanosoma brucei gambiense DAL972]CBH15046.1 hypothetical protein, unlikely [Trypanosoma brucei gambiense DAL972]|eukprot:XP_011777312.1 hypothetical protein, unlikely [Trypanosoma brucei gambiense DAL972]
MQIKSTDEIVNLIYFFFLSSEETICPKRVDRTGTHVHSYSRLYAKRQIYIIYITYIRVCMCAGKFIPFLTAEHGNLAPTHILNQYYDRHFLYAFYIKQGEGVIYLVSVID